MTLAEKLKTSRLNKKLTLAELSETSGVSTSMLSQIERGISIPTVRSLEKIVDALGTTIPSLFSSDVDSNPIAPSKPAQIMYSSDVDIVTKSNRKKLVPPGGELYYELLCPDLQRKIEFVRTYMPVGAKLEEFITHEGEECGIILKGKMRGYLGDKVVTLEEGDSIYFNSRIPHRWENVGEEDIEAIWVITPPSF